MHFEGVRLKVREGMEVQGGLFSSLSIHPSVMKHSFISPVKHLVFRPMVSTGK